MIDTSSWKEFHLYDIFDIDMGNKMDRGKMYDGTIAFVGRTANNNGINARVGKVVNHKKYGTIEPYKKGCITLALGGSIGSCFIQEEPFYTSQNVAVLIPKTNQSDYALRFITSVITHSVLHGKYEAFIEELNKHIKTDFVISLPATSDGQPDWQYMEDYMKAVMEESEKSLENLMKADDTKHLIDVSGWGEFRIGDIFDVIKGTRLTKADMRDGVIKFVGSSAMNNGETHRIANNEKLHPANTITVCYNGSVGETFYQDEIFWASDDVNVLYPKFDMTKLMAMFICPIIKSVGQKYAFIDKWKQEDMKNETIPLPITSTGEPDWQYMEDYMRTIMDKSEQIISDLQMGA